MIPDQDLYRLQYKIHLEAGTQHVGQYLFRKGIQDRRQIGENAAFGDATVSVTESSNGVYNVNFNPDVNP